MKSWFILKSIFVKAQSNYFQIFGVKSLFILVGKISFIASFVYVMIITKCGIHVATS